MDVAILKFCKLDFNQQEAYITFGYFSGNIWFQWQSSEKGRIWTKKEAISVLWDLF